MCKESWKMLKSTQKSRIRACRYNIIIKTCIKTIALIYSPHVQLQFALIMSVCIVFSKVLYNLIILAILKTAMMERNFVVLSKLFGISVLLPYTEFTFNTLTSNHYDENIENQITVLKRFKTRKTIKILFLYKVEGISGTKLFGLRRLRIVTYNPMIVQFFFLNLHFKLFKIANNYMNILKIKLKRLFFYCLNYTVYPNLFLSLITLVIRDIKNLIHQNQFLENDFKFIKTLSYLKNIKYNYWSQFLKKKYIILCTYLHKICNLPKDNFFFRQSIFINWTTKIIFRFRFVEVPAVHHQTRNYEKIDGGELNSRFTKSGRQKISRLSGTTYVNNIYVYDLELTMFSSSI
ncbi:hypothetical protein AGLY_010997 [Aphis glycines]|uniref:Uncharacterized protein n=1 Tax=Aphis glycines TaxID=307491 RepID=A0A6G0TD40_APHGL|nr:hypothetical protein AGLY_010997 [Aphis glycines]